MDTSRTLLRVVVLGAAAVTLTIVMTWPLGRTTAVPTSDDAFFSIWRLAWIAHQLPNDPWHLFDANIFHPATGTLAYSDAMLLVGVMAAPMFWGGLDPGTIHNVLLIAAMASSALAAFALAHRLTGSRHAACLAALIFGFAPYRFAHIGHLELQWAVWIPLSMLLLHRFVENPTWRRGIAIGACVAAQMLCSIYYGVFLSLFLMLAWLALTATSPQPKRILVISPVIALPLLIGAALYAGPYSKARADHGPRNLAEQRTYSAVLGDFARVPPENVLRGRRGDGSAAADERSLYPGAAALSLAIVALIPPVSGPAWLYGVLGLVSIDATLGVNGVLFPMLQDAVPVIRSLRSPARFAILVLLSVSVLAAIGADRIFRRWSSRGNAVCGALAALCLVEYWSAPIPIRAFDSRPSEAHQYLFYQPPGSVVLELPAPSPDSLWLYESTYQLRSINHWQPMINGYSGFAPREYVQTLKTLERFPAEDTIRRLREIGVKFVLLNREYYDETKYQDVRRQLAVSPYFWPIQVFRVGPGEIAIAELKATAERR